MRGLENGFYLSLLIIANLIATVQLIAALKWPRLARVSFFLVFAWAGWTNWFESQSVPKIYLEYADLTWSRLYRNFITGWFARNISLSIGFIATCQGLIAISMLLKGWLYKIGSIGAIIFLLAILPLGVGAGFPCTAVMAIAIVLLLRKRSNDIWKKEKG